MSAKPELEELIKAADQAAAQGQREQSLALWEQVLDVDPHHPRALNVLGNWALNTGDPQRAKRLLETAVQQVPNEPAILLNLSAVYRTLGDLPRTLQTLDKALALDPYFVHALFQKAQVLEAMGEKRRAARAYKNFLKCAPPEIHADARFQAVLTYARQAIDDHNASLAAWLEEQVKPLQLQHPPEAFKRFNACLAALTEKQPLIDPVQKPTLLHFPGVRVLPFYPDGDFPWLKTLEAATSDIQQELSGLLERGPDGGGTFVPYVANPPGTPLNQWKELDHSQRWGAFFLWKSGQKIEENCALCPKTAALLEGLPRADVPARAPTAMFSLLHPKTRIPPHTGVTNTRLVVHLPLIIPDHCGFRVGPETREWKVGKAWVFDDTIEHEAWNESNELRAILIIDIWNPDLTDIEQELIRRTFKGLDAFYGGDISFGDGL